MEPQRRQNILVVDEDLGFVLWLGQLLAEVGLQAIPAFSWNEAESRVAGLNIGVDFVVCNPYSAGVPGRLQSLAGVNKQLKVVLALDPGLAPPRAMVGYPILMKPSGSEEVLYEEWLVRVKQAINDAVPFGHNATKGWAS